MVSTRNRPLDEPTDARATIREVGRARIPTVTGTFEATAFCDTDGHEHLAYVSTTSPLVLPLVRLHSECLTGDVLGSLRCDCGSQLRRALEITGAEGGAVLYLRGHEGRGVGLGQKMLAYGLQDEGLDTVEANLALGHAADLRRYDVAAAMLEALDLTTIRLLSNNPAKARGLAEHGIEVVEEVPLAGEVTAENSRYLATKRDRLDHTYGPIGDIAT